MKSTNKLLKYTVIAISLVFILIFTYISLNRIGYPFELEWMEGGSVEHLDRILNDEPIYGPPSIEFIPYIYPPFYYYTAIPVSWITGVSLLPLRIVSLGSTFLLFLIIFLFVRKETGSSYLALASSGLFAAAFGLSGAWYDLARVDMLFVLFMMLAVYIIRFQKTKGWYIVAGIIASLSFLTKQTALPIFAFVGLYLLIRERKISWYFNITFAFILIATTIFYTITTDGWYWFWNFILPADHRWNWNFLVHFWTNDIIKPFGIASLFSIIFMITAKKQDRNKYLFYLFLIIGIVSETWLSRLHYGGYLNVLIPLYLLISLLSILGFKEVLNYFEAKENSQLKISLLSIALIFQFVTLTYPFRHFTPSKADKIAGWQLVEELKSFKGDVYIAGNIYFARLAGKKVYTHYLLIQDLEESSTKYNKQIKREFENALKEHRFDVVIDYFNQVESQVLTKYYYKKSKVFDDPELSWMMTGYSTRPEHIFLPKK